MSATWSILSNRATDAPYTILDGSNVLATVDVNQELVPDDFSDGGADWEDLGFFNMTGTTLVVELSDNANEYVIADAVRIERMTELVDGMSIVDFGTTEVGTSVSKTFVVANVGGEDLTLSAPISVPAGFSVVSSFGRTTLAPGESTTFVARLDASSAGTFNGTLSFANNDGDENPFDFPVTATVALVEPEIQVLNGYFIADAVRLEGLRADILVEQVTRDREDLNLRGTAAQLEQLGVACETLHLVLGKIAIAAEDMNRLLRDA